MILLDYSKDLRRLLAEGKTLDEALAALRARGLSIMQCINAVRIFRKCDLTEAKQIVHFSPAWKDVREGNERFHQELEDALNQDAQEGEQQDKH
jgi:hypothetical protein